MLSLDELNLARKYGLDQNNKLGGLLKFREKTRSFVEQCLADREILKEIDLMKENNFSIHEVKNFKLETSKTYCYNGTVIYNSHMWYQVMRCIVYTT